jgi:hypothetical protein
MRDAVESHINRRDILQGGLLLGAGAFLAGCQASKPATSMAALPNPMWPDTQPGSGPIKAAPAPAAASGRVRVIPRSAWTSAQPKWSISLPLRNVTHITVHHDALNSVGISSQDEVARRLVSIRRSHMSRGSEWVDIGYHYIIDPAGRVWEGRPVRIEGAHVAKKNPQNLGVMVMGNFEEHRPTDAAIASLDAFLTDQMRVYRVPVNRIYTHRELADTACPGRNLQKYMVSTRSSNGRLALG